MTTRRIAPVIALLGALAALAGCGGGGGGRSAQQVLRDTAASLHELHSGVLTLRLTLEPRGGAVAGAVGFELAGPVELGGGGLPIARLRYTQLAGSRNGTATFVSTGRAAFVEVGGTAYRLPAARADELAGSARAVRQGVTLPVGRWVRAAKVSDGGDVGGTPTDRVSAALDAPAALHDIFAAARRAGAAAPDLSGAGAADLRRAVDESSLELWAGRRDHILRRLLIRIGFRVEAPPALRARLRGLTGARLVFDVGVDRPNQPVRVAAPAGARPASALPRPRG